MTKVIQNKLKNIQKHLKSDKELNNEEYVKKCYIEPTLAALGWKRIYPYKSPLNSCYREGNYILTEYQIGKERERPRPDYILMNNKHPKIIVEAKTGKENLKDGEYPIKDQLSSYFYQMPSVKLGVLTNGFEWWFCLPRKRDKWRLRTFCDINFIRDPLSGIYDNFMNYMHFENVNKGIATRKARKCADKKAPDDIIMDLYDDEIENLIKELSSNWLILTPEQKNYLMDLEIEIHNRQIWDK